MNVKQLELKRLREGLDSVRHARHVVQAMRKPAAALLRLEHAANVRLKRADAAYERITGDTLLDADIREGISAGVDIPENLKAAGKALADEERRISKRIARLQKDRQLLSSAVELRNLRKKLEAARQKKSESKAAKKKLASLELLEAVRAAAVNETNARVLHYLETIGNDVRHSDMPSGDFFLGLAGLRNEGRHVLADRLKVALEKYKGATQ